MRVSILVLNDDAAARGTDAHPQELGPRRDQRTLTRCATLADLDDRLEEAEQLLDAAFALRIDIGELLEATLLGAHTSSVEEPLDEGNSDVPNADQNLNLDDFPHIRRLEVRQSRSTPPPSSNRHWKILDRLDRFITRRQPSPPACQAELSASLGSQPVSWPESEFTS